MRNKFKKILPIISLVIAILILAFFFIKELPAVYSFTRDISYANSLESVKDSSVSYGIDGFIVNSSFLFIGDGNEASSRADLTESMLANTAMLYGCVISSCAIYASLVTLFASAFIKTIAPKSRFILVITALSLFALIYGIETAMILLGGVSLAGVDLQIVAGLFCAVLAIAATMLFAEFFYRKIKIKMLVSVVVVVLFIIGYFTGNISKARIWTPAYQSSFGYVYDIEPRVFDEAYEEYLVFNDDGTLSFMDQTFEPEMVPNEEHAFGVMYAMNIAFEVINPSAGIYVNLYSEYFCDNNCAYIMYMAQAALWIVTGILLTKSKKIKESELSDESTETICS